MTDALAILEKLVEEAKVKAKESGWANLALKQRALNAGYAALGRNANSVKELEESVYTAEDLVQRIAALRDEYVIRRSTAHLAPLRGEHVASPSVHTTVPVQHPNHPPSRIFVVHGHDDAMKEAVARVVTMLGLEPIILHEQPNRGDTIIEKLVRSSEVGYAIVLLSADDIGASRSQPGSLRPRARQNVLFELGFFIGRLGRKRVMALHPSVRDFEFPSDISGVVWTPFEPEWRFKLVQELNAAGYRVDANRLLSR